MMEERVWNSFESKVDDLFAAGYNLPSSLHVIAIETVENRLLKWKNRTPEQNGCSETSEDHTETSKTKPAPEVTSNPDFALPHVPDPNNDESPPSIKRRRQRPSRYQTSDLEHSISSRTSLFNSKKQHPLTKKKRVQLPGTRIPHADASHSGPKSPDTPQDTQAPSQSENTSEEQSEETQVIKPELDQNSTEEENTSTSTKVKKCHLCFKSFASSSGYGYHMRRHKEAVFPCPDCSYVSVTDRQLRCHKKMLHNCDEGKRKFVCDQCDKKFPTQRSLQFHLDMHKNGPVKCPHCPKEFGSQVGYDLHLKLHTGEGLHQCPLCQYISGSQAMVRTHIQRVHDKVASHLCDTCGRGFVSKYLLNRHRETVHMREEIKNRHSCPHCDHKTHCPISLKAHIRNLHTETTGFVCNVCGITLKYKHSLKDHQKRHSSKKLYECSQCSFRGTCEKDVKGHIKRKHIGGSWKCDVCGKVFNEKGHLVRHKVIHTGETPFACRLCHYRCNVRDNLRKHMLNVHKVDEKVRQGVQKLDLKEEESAVVPLEKDELLTMETDDNTVIVQTQNIYSDQPIEFLMDNDTISSVVFMNIDDNR